MQEDFTIFSLFSQKKNFPGKDAKGLAIPCEWVYNINEIK